VTRTGPAALPLRTPSRPLLWWYASVAAGGLLFGLLGDRRPLGSDMLAQPLVLFFIAVGVALVILRIVRRRPVPELIPERALVIGCLVGGAAFLAGNFLVTHITLR
jgi:hypothetical protein